MGAFFTMYGQAVVGIAMVWPWFWPVVGGIFGAVLGSFLNCARWRIPQGKSLRSPPSMCPSCQTTLRAVDLVPIFSYLWLRGRCRYCKVEIGSASMWLEVACTLVGMAVVYVMQIVLLGH